ncbi:MAG: ABC transporter ATP-binding protein [Campylobacteraceae bacterium]|jgi:ABC-2 type transport system ATP-binding protein|nr:ABC transporter ATP-binding protein [Campylobacteraceae bacterium]
MLQIKNIGKNYNSLKALKSVSLNLPNSGIFALLGVNGAGKTTLISILCGIVKADSGEIFYNETPYFDALEKDHSLCSLTPQEFAFYPSLSVEENINFFSQINALDTKKRKEMIDFALNICALEEYMQKRTANLSGGLKRRLNLAIGLLNNPKILFLDEPTVGIDPKTREFILNSIKELAKERLIVYTSHYMHEVDFLADEIAVINDGEILTSFKNSRQSRVLTLELQEHNAANIKILNEFMPFTECGGCLQSGAANEESLSKLLEFTKKRNLIFKSISLSPLSVQTLFLNPSNDEAL